MVLTEKNLRERKFHDKLHSNNKGRFENIFYKALFNSAEDFYSFLKSNSENAEVLDYGCGTGVSLEKVMQFKPKKIVGIDISENSIKKAKKKIKESNLDIELIVGNCEQTKFESNKFDIIYGTGILHHLQFSKCLGEIHRILKPKGKLLFIEPLGTNPLINIYRKLSPGSRSIDEHPLINEDFNYINQKFSYTKIKYYGFLTLIFFPFYKNPEKSVIFNLLKNLDQILFKIKIFRLLAWSSLIIAQKN